MPRNRWASTPRAPRRRWPDARRAFIVAFAALAAAGAAHADFTARVVHVLDGDTLTVVARGREVRIRLWGIDAPEHGQPWSRSARDALATRALHREALVVERGIDAYGRTLARVSVGGVDLAEAQLRDGYAWVYRRYASDERLLALENDARAARRGLWSRADAEAPWRWRERHAP